MIAKRSNFWIDHRSRILMAGIAGLGAIETAYLTWVKLSGGSAACPTAGCNQVLDSPYSVVLGLPLSLFGFLAYVSLGVLAVVSMVAQPQTRKSSHSPLQEWTGLLMFGLSTAMVISSSYLMYIMIFEIQELCPYCVASALFSASLFLIATFGQDWEDLGQLGITGVTVGMITLIGLLGIYNGLNPSGNSSPANNAFEITTTSGAAELSLARHLQQLEAKKYGAYWCPHCQDQKQLFGQEAFAMIDYIECDSNGKNARPQLCRDAGITGYPTWEIKGQLYSGTLSLEKLADLSGYQGRRDFKN